jgi:hypothetical protein
MPLQACRISSAVHSTTLPPLRGAGWRLCGAGCLIAIKRRTGVAMLIDNSLLLCLQSAYSRTICNSGYDFCPSKMIDIGRQSLLSVPRENQSTLSGEMMDF